MKRVVDFLVAFVGLIFLAPVLALIGLLVRVFLGFPVLFRQVRPGLNGECFELVKFRSMTQRRDSRAELLSDSDRLTGFGRFLRATSLDELPELWNVLKGDMSLVGPRPLLVEYLPRYSATQSRRHEVRPGVTGLAQVKGRNSLTWEAKFQMDVWYVEHQTLRLDCAILFWTLKSVFKREGISAEGTATMQPFLGTD